MTLQASAMSRYRVAVSPLGKLNAISKNQEVLKNLLMTSPPADDQKCEVRYQSLTQHIHAQFPFLNPPRPTDGYNVLKAQLRVLL
jgi:hypothetical protein